MHDPSVFPRGFCDLSGIIVYKTNQRESPPLIANWYTELHWDKTSKEWRVDKCVTEYMGAWKAE